MKITMQRLSMLVMMITLGMGGCKPYIFGPLHPSEEPAPVCTVSESCAQPKWCQGDLWIYDDGYQLRVNEVVGDLTTFSLIGKSDQWVRRRGLLRESSNLGDMERRMVYRTGQPLESLRDLLQSKPGTAFSFHQEYRAGEQMIRQKVQVRLDAREQITVPAGKFDDALVLTWTTESLTSAWTSLERWWYVPEIGHYVRLEYKYGSGPFGSRVLIRHCAHDDKVCQKIYGR